MQIKYTENADNLVLKSELYRFFRYEDGFIKIWKNKFQLKENNDKDLYKFSNKWIKEVNRYWIMKNDLLNKNMNLKF